MADPRQSKLPSTFDDMVAQNRRRFDDLNVRRHLRADAPVVGGKPGVEQQARAGRTSAVLARARTEPDTPAIRRLNELFGSDWSYEIAERRRDGEEAIVLCKLRFGKNGIVRTHFGHAKISKPPILGASGEVRFRLNNVEQDESDAFRRATEAALMNCLDLI